MSVQHTISTNKLLLLDHGFIQLVDSMGSDLSVVNSARVSFGKRTEKLEGKDENLITYLAAHNHTSPFRHVQFQFHVKAPEAVARQWYKHVIGCSYSGGVTGSGEKDHGWNEISGRYVDLSDVEMYCPEQFRAQSINNRQASSGTLGDGDAQAASHAALTNHYKLCTETYRYLISIGVAKEQARLALPFGLYTEWYWTASLQAVAHFISLRQHPGAQWEIQQYAQAMEHLATSVAPYSLGALQSVEAK